MGQGNPSCSPTPSSQEVADQRVPRLGGGLVARTQEASRPPVWPVGHLSPCGRSAGPLTDIQLAAPALQAQCPSSHPGNSCATAGRGPRRGPGGRHQEDPQGERTYSVSESSRSDTAGTTLSTGVHTGLTQERPRWMTSCTYLGNNGVCKLHGPAVGPPVASRRSGGSWSGLSPQTRLPLREADRTPNPFLGCGIGLEDQGLHQDQLRDQRRFRPSRVPRFLLRADPRVPGNTLWDPVTSSALTGASAFWRGDASGLLPVVWLFLLHLPQTWVPDAGIALSQGAGRPVLGLAAQQHLSQRCLPLGATMCGPDSDFHSDRPGWGRPTRRAQRPLLCGLQPSIKVPRTLDPWSG